MGAVQRFPAGLLEILGAKTGGVNPTELAREVSCSLDIAQMLGLGQVENREANDPAVAEGSGVLLTVPVNEWWVLYAASIHIVKTGTMGDGAFSLRLAPQGAPVSVALASNYLVTATGCPDWAVVAWVAPYPMLMPPGTAIAAVADLVSTDPTVDVTLRARIGVLL